MRGGWPEVVGDARFFRHEGHTLVGLARTRPNLYPWHCVTCDEPCALIMRDGVFVGMAEKIHSPCPGLCAARVCHWECVAPGLCEDCRDDTVRSMAKVRR